MFNAHKTFLFFILTLELLHFNCGIIVKEQEIELTNIYIDKSKNNYYQVLNGLNNHIINKLYSTIKSPGIENIQYVILRNKINNDYLFTELQLSIIKTYLINKHNNVLLSNQFTSSLSTSTFSTLNSSDANNEDAIGDYIIMEDINSFATGGRLSVGESNQLNAKNLDINALYQQSLNNRDGTLGFTLSNSQVNTLNTNNNKPETNNPSQPAINSIPPSSLSTTKSSLGHYINSPLIIFYLFIFSLL